MQQMYVGVAALADIHPREGALSDFLSVRVRPQGAYTLM